MVAEKRKNERLIVLLIIGCLALNYPLLSLFDKGASLFGIPLLYLFLFTFWALFILLIAAIIERKQFPRIANLKIPKPGKTD